MINLEQLRFNFDKQPSIKEKYIFENELQEQLFNKVQENHMWRNNSLYDKNEWR